MSETDKPHEPIDWSLTTWEGSRREQLRRWAQLPLEQIIAALEEMQALNDSLSGASAYTTPAQSPVEGSAVSEPDPHQDTCHNKNL